MSQAPTLRRTSLVGEYLNELKEARMLVNTDLERAIRRETDATRILSPDQMDIVREALGEMNRRELGVYTAAAIIIAAINSFKSRSE